MSTNNPKKVMISKIIANTALTLLTLINYHYIILHYPSSYISLFAINLSSSVYSSEENAPNFLREPIRSYLDLVLNWLGLLPIAVDLLKIASGL